VYIDTILLCTATALMCLSSGVPFGEDVSGAPYVQNAISTVFGGVGPLFITGAMILFAFTTLLGNLYYTNNALNYLNGKREPSKLFMRVYYVVCVVIIFVGAIMPAEAVWALADITMGGMAFFNLPSCIALSGVVIAALKDYERQKKAGHDPVFRAKHIGMDENELDCWKMSDHLSHEKEYVED
jgi:AGCS family alanine or glycine:cation symporter